MRNRQSLRDLEHLKDHLAGIRDAVSLMENIINSSIKRESSTKRYTDDDNGKHTDISGGISNMAVNIDSCMDIAKKTFIKKESKL